MRQKFKHFLTTGFMLLGLLLYSSVGWGQGLEDFTNSNATGSYADNSFVGNDGITWTYTESRDANSDANGSGINLPALMLRWNDAAEPSIITSSTVSGGIGDFSVKLYKGFTGGGDRQVELFVNGVSQGTSTPFDDYDEHIFEVTGINIDGDIVISIENITGKQVIIDDITWTGYTSGGPVPPSITNITQAPAADITSSDAVSVSADVTAGDAALNNVELRWGTTSGDYINSITMSVDAGDTYVSDTDIPAQADATTVYYVVFADDADGESTTSSEQSYTVTDPASTTLPYEETFVADLGDCYVYTVAGTNPWEQSSGTALANGYQGENPEEHWLVLPAINFDNYSSEVMTFTTFAQYGTIDANNYLKLYYSADYTGLGDPSAATWTELTFNKPADGSVGSTEIETASGDVDLSSITGTEVYLAFKYYSTDSPTGWKVDDISIVENLSADATLATFTLGEQDVTGLTNLEVADPVADEGATLFVDDFTGFEGIVIDATDAAATVEVKLNDVVVDPGDYASQALADGDVVVATVTAEDGSMAYYKVNITGENRELTLTGPALPTTFSTGDDITFTWTSANIANVNIYAVEPGTKATANLINESGPIDASLGTWTHTIENGDFGTFTFRIADASDVTFFNETADEATINDTQAPQGETFYPEHASSGVALDFTLTITFDEDIALGTGNLEVFDNNDTKVLTLTEADATVTGNELTMDVSDLAYMTDYYILTDEGLVEDLSGNPAAALTDPTAWTFTTQDEPTGDLFFSEYIEGTSNNKALEIYNGTGADIDLTAYEVKKAGNGGAWDNTLDLTGTLTNGDVYVIANAGADAAILDVADVTSEVTYYNGNDALGLFKDGVLIDAIGTQGEDATWDVAGTTEATAEHTLVRKNSVTEGNTDWTASAGTNTDDSEWIVYGQDEFSYIGMHGSTEPALTITSPEDGSTLYTTTVNVTFDVQNFTVGNGGTDDGYVVYTLDEGAETDLFTTDAFDLSDLSLGEHTLEMWLVDNNGVSLDPAVTYSVTFTIDEMQALSIYDIQYTTAEGDGTYPSLYEGALVETSGIVTAVDDGSAYFIQDGTGAWNGIYVYDTNAVSEGDEVALTGEVVEYYGLTQLANISAFEIVSSGNTLPEATTLSTVDANMEDYESVLVKVENAECTDADVENNFGMWTVNDGSGALLIDDDLFAFTPTAGTNYNVTGVGFYSYDNSKILPRSADDIEVATSVGKITATAVKLYPNPAQDVLFISSDSDVSRVEVYNLLGQNVMSTNIESKQTELNVSDLDAGMYIIKVYGENAAQTHRFIKN